MSETFVRREVIIIRLMLTCIVSQEEIKYH